ncbi:MAG: glycosyltransferase [Pseudomonas sp.]|uniref:glycosyltransferase n=1 Tax=Pseudomonas sp. TaxID=306 RepID=UPI003D6E8719
MLSIMLLALMTLFTLVFMQELIFLFWAFKLPTAHSMPCRTPEICVLIPCFNEEKVLEATVIAILQSRNVRLSRVICIDDGSTDGTLALMHKLSEVYRDPLRIVAMANGGKAMALNKGLSEVNTPLFVCVDADTLVFPETLSRLSRTLLSTGAAAVAGHVVVGGGKHDSWIHNAQIGDYETAANIERRVLSTLRWLPVVPGAAGAFLTEAVRALGGFSNSTMTEDTHLTMQLLLAGHDVRHQSEAPAMTEVPNTIAHLYKQRLRWATGEIQVVIRTAKPAMSQRARMRCIWAYMAITHCLMPLFAFPAYILFAGCLVAALFSSDVPNSLTIVGLLVILAGSLTSYLRQSYARQSDARYWPEGSRMHRRHRWLGETLIMSSIAWLAAWAGLCRILFRRTRAWGKVPRRGDVNLPDS